MKAFGGDTRNLFVVACSLFEGLFNGGVACLLELGRYHHPGASSRGEETKKKGNPCRVKVFTLNNKQVDAFKGPRKEELRKDAAPNQVRERQYEYIYFYRMPLC